MGFFRTHAPKKSISSLNSSDADLTSLDPPNLLNIPVINNGHKRHDSFASQLSQMKIVTQQNAQKFQSNATKTVSPTNSEFSVKNMTLVSSGLKGEQERNMILEQQVRILSQQAAMALDRLSESNKENEKLKKENEAFKKDTKHRFSFGRRQSSLSTTSSGSSVQTSVFSGGNRANYRSKNSSISSIQTNIDQLKNTNDTFFGEIHQNYEKQLNSMRAEALSSKEELEKNKLVIQSLEHQIEQLQSTIFNLKKENKSIFHKLTNKNQKHNLEIEYYKNQIKLLSTQLAQKAQRTIQLSDRLYAHNQTSRAITNTRKILSL